MSENREEQEIQDQDGVKKQFIREQLKPQWRKNMMIYMRRVLLVLGAAVLFGGISAVSFYVMRTYFPWQDLDGNSMAVPTHTVSARPVQERTVSDEIDEQMLESLESYDKISRQLAAVGKQADAALVRLSVIDLSFSGVFGGKDKLYCGILFHETAQSYYALTEYAAAQENMLMASSFLPEAHEMVRAEVVGANERLNLAVVSIAKSGFTKELRDDLVIAELGDSSALALGSSVLAVGMPNSKIYSVCAGRITTIMQSVSIQDQALQLYTMDLPYQAGRSGFILDIHGQLLGVLTAKYVDTTGEIDTAFFTLSDLWSDLDLMIQGKQVPYLGIHGFVLSGDIEGQEIEEGIYVDEVEAKSPAYQGGMRVTDIISEVDGHQWKSMEELHEYLAACQSGQEIVVMVYRHNGSEYKKKRLKITVK